MEQQLENYRFTQGERYEVGDNLRMMCSRKGMTQEQLSEATGINRDVISRHMNGTLCGMEALTQYAIALKCSMEDLLPSAYTRQIKDNTEETQKYWDLLMGLPEKQKQAVFHMILVMQPETA